MLNLFLDDLTDIEKEDIDLAIAASLSDWNEKEVVEDESQSEDEQLCIIDEEEDEHVGRVLLDEDEQLAKIQQEEDARLAKVQQEEDELLAKIQQDEHERLAKAQLEEDEQLARAIQESLSLDSLPRYGNDSSFLSMPHLFPPGYRICAGCKTEIGQGRFLSCMGAVWHPECFCCNACHLPITDYEFSMSSNRPYHKSCYREKNHPRCDVCKKYVSINFDGLKHLLYDIHISQLIQLASLSIELILSGIKSTALHTSLMVLLVVVAVKEWRSIILAPKTFHPTINNYELLTDPSFCPSSPSPFLLSFQSVQPRDTKYLLLDDGRKLCLECLDSSIMDTHECQPLYLEIQEFYEGLHMKLEQQIPMLLVERQALNEAMEGEKNASVNILRRPRIGAGYRAVDMITEPYRLTRRCEVTAILVLYGLPRLLTGSILAHEMMHAWLRLKGYPNLSPEVEEGICQIESDTSSAYGDGFRLGNQAMLIYGIKRTLDHIHMTGSFPI
ncbi:hypothetical protein Fmac_002461 [Flemingia macrophylla]|uniref:LIM zinc-binding domain-containing protein n=1 Tax=Flemingia macrophylla TaxID=520843 RepID=A0ABD1NJZ9_9FABA